MGRTAAAWFNNNYNKTAVSYYRWIYHTLYSETKLLSRTWCWRGLQRAYEMLLQAEVNCGLWTCVQCSSVRTRSVIIIVVTTRIPPESSAKTAGDRSRLLSNKQIVRELVRLRARFAATRSAKRLPESRRRKSDRIIVAGFRLYPNEFFMTIRIKFRFVMRRAERVTFVRRKSFRLRFPTYRFWLKYDVFYSLSFDCSQTILKIRAQFFFGRFEFPVIRSSV